MPDLPTIAGGPGNTGSVPAGSVGVTLTAGAANAKAATWGEIIPALTYPSDWLLVMFANPTAVGLSGGFLIDIGVGASTAEQVVIANLHMHASAAAMGFNRGYLMPIRVEAGTRISGRVQCATASATVRCTVTTMSSPIDAPPGMGRVETLGAVTSGATRGTTLDPGAVANTDVVAQLIASTGFNYRWFCLSVGNQTDVVWTAQSSWLVDVCTGAAGSEVALVSDLMFQGSTGSDGPFPPTVCFPIAVAAGSRLSIRARCTSVDAGDRVLDLVGYGVG